MVWGFADITISTNLARDLGTRLVALIFYGREAFTYMGYAPIAILVNIPATLFATAYCKQRALDSFCPTSLFPCAKPKDPCLTSHINVFFPSPLTVQRLTWCTNQTSFC